MDQDAFAAGMKMAGIKPRKKRGRRKRMSRTEMFSAELQRVEREGLEPADSLFLMTELAKIALGPIDLGPLMPQIGRRVNEICEIAVNGTIERERKADA